MPDSKTVSLNGQASMPTAIEIQPYAPGLLLMTLPVGVLIPETGAVKLLGAIHDALESLRKLDVEHAAEHAAQKNGQPARRGIAAKKRKG